MLVLVDRVSGIDRCDGSVVAIASGSEETRKDGSIDEQIYGDSCLLKYC